MLHTQELEKRTTESPARSEASRRVPRYTPRFDLLERDDAFLLTFEVPGVDEKNLDISVERDVLTVSALATGAAHEGYTLSHAEFDTERSYYRQLRFDSAIDADKITAQLKNGLLHLVLPKRTEARTRKIAVTTA